jgi:hypothetical protein
MRLVRVQRNVWPHGTTLLRSARKSFERRGLRAPNDSWSMLSRSRPKNGGPHSGRGGSRLYLRTGLAFRRSKVTRVPAAGIAIRRSPVTCHSSIRRPSGPLPRGQVNRADRRVGEPCVTGVFREWTIETPTASMRRFPASVRSVRVPPNSCRSGPAAACPNSPRNRPLFRSRSRRPPTHPHDGRCPSA